jgi:hypothetical protein
MFVGFAPGAVWPGRTQPTSDNRIVPIVTRCRKLGFIICLHDEKNSLKIIEWKKISVKYQIGFHQSATSKVAGDLFFQKLLRFPVKPFFQFANRFGGFLGFAPIFQDDFE